MICSRFERKGRTANNETNMASWVLSTEEPCSTEGEILAQAALLIERYNECRTSRGGGLQRSSSFVPDVS